MKQSINKVIFIYPSLKGGETTHYPYWHELLEEVAKELDVIVIFESGDANRKLKNVNTTIVQSITLKPFNLIERFIILCRFIRKGYKNIYIHYSYWSVFITKLISIFTPLTIYYWNCEKYTTKPKDALLPLALKWCDVLVTGSQSIGNSYKNTFGLENKTINIVPNWVKPFDTPAKKLKDSKTHILFVHHLSPRKGTRELATIISYTKKAFPQAHFHIMGNGPDEEVLKSQVASHRLQDDVTFYGGLPLKQVISYYKAVDYLIMPSRSEGFPRVILEAMICKLPFVSTDVGNVKEIVSEDQLHYLVVPKKPTLFANKLVELIKDKNKAPLIKANYFKALSFNKNKATTALLQVVMK